MGHEKKRNFEKTQCCENKDFILKNDKKIMKDLELDDNINFNDLNNILKNSDSERCRKSGGQVTSAFTTFSHVSQIFAISNSSFEGKDFNASYDADFVTASYYCILRDIALRVPYRGKKYLYSILLALYCVESL